MYSTGQRFICTEVTSYKNHILVTLMSIGLQWRQAFRDIKDPALGGRPDVTFADCVWVKRCWSLLRSLKKSLGKFWRTVSSELNFFSLILKNWLRDQKFKTIKYFFITVEYISLEYHIKTTNYQYNKR